MSEFYKIILEALKQNGFIMLNEHSLFLSLNSLQGDWADYMRLISEGETFVTKLIEGKTTLLSSEIYYAIKELPLKNYELTSSESTILEFIRLNPDVDSEIIRKCTAMSKNEIDKSLIKLQNLLYITVTSEGQRLNNNWGTYCYSTSKVWESKKTIFTQSVIVKKCHDRAMKELIKKSNRIFKETGDTNI